MENFLYVCALLVTLWLQHTLVQLLLVKTFCLSDWSPQKTPKNNLTDSSAPGKGGIAAGWKALRALSDASRQAHAIPRSKNRANIWQPVWYLPEACVVHLRSRPKYQNILRMSSKPPSQHPSEDKTLWLTVRQGFSSWSCRAHTYVEGKEEKNIWGYKCR